MIGAPELIAILVAALFLFGPQKLPELARSLGSAMGEFKKAQRAAELELTQFDAYTRKARDTVTSVEKEKEQHDVPCSSKEIKTETDLKIGKNPENTPEAENLSLNRKSP
jgi:sec-independent protein translocase protein TatA